MPLLAFGILELIFLFGFLILMVIGCSIDRRGAPAMKWWVAAIAIAAVTWYAWSDLTLAGMVALLTSPAFWVPVGGFLALGLLYSVFEFLYTIRTTARDAGEFWKKRKPNVEAPDFASELRYRVADLNTNYGHNVSFLDFEGNSSTADVSTTINRGRLAGFLTAWTIFWPGYLLSFVIGDMVTEFFRALADKFGQLGQRIVDSTFADTFKM